ncbi:glutamyl-tRNA synthetase [Lophiostoma macrostomum CBS 122681]|uniref:Glutamate--tRNA ligase, mitochondrial n=1 Tax=Lophiostoma macrostomum CBS 122681 TaxID=1314788 RepID=A0A6A6TIX9_9PLEO|nr:glutamyl-tRNA synthetase [Lophiostoma macrostomum CBS 122681]
MWKESKPARSKSDYPRLQQKKVNTDLTTPARTRFAPSPTGYLHLGSLRTALFNYLLAKRTGGQFLLRVEDTDQKRTVPDAEQRLYDHLRWAGLQWDEGPEVGGPYGPYRQSERSALYREHAQQLLDSGNAYRCFCSSERLHSLAEHRHKLGLATDYDRTCTHISAAESEEKASKGEKFVIRLKVPDVYPSYNDLTFGPFKPLQRRRGEDSYEDPILLKSDGLPTYHLANVVDDHHMHITHVIRGSEWMPSTPKHIFMYSAFNWQPPEFAHVGLLVDENGNKLSKRNFDTDITAFKDMEIFPETLVNFAALLGWSHTQKSDVMDMDKLTSIFNLKFTKGNAIVTFGKLHFLQRKHAISRIHAGGPPHDELVQNILKLLKDPDSPYKERDWKPTLGSNPTDYISRILTADSENYTNANEFVYRNQYFFTRSEVSLLPFIPEAPDVSERCKALAEVSEADWKPEKLKSKVEEIIDAREGGRKEGKHVYHYLRLALSGKKEGMRLYDMMWCLGRSECLRRLAVDV